MLYKEPTRSFNYYNYDVSSQHEIRACLIQIQLKHALEPASLKIRRTGGDAS